MYYKFFAFISLFQVSQVFAQSVKKTMLRLPDTGESTSYTNTFGEDHDYIIYPPFFKIPGNGTVTDTVTGLMWQQTDGGEMTIENAIIYCGTLTLGGHTDWRLPDAQEGFSILNMQYANPAIDTKIFTKTAAEYWWTSETQANDATKIWATNAGGGVGNHPKAETISAGGTKKFHVRAVRDINAPATIPKHYTDNGDGTVTDNLTNLVWQKVPSNNTYSWEQALNYAESLSFAGANDWRVPNIKELQSINDESATSPSVNTTFFNSVGVKHFWSSTTLPNQTAKAWYWDTQFGITTYDSKTNLNYLLCVRGNAINTTVRPIAPNVSLSTVFPNPFTNKINLSNNQSDVELFDGCGQLIYFGKNVNEQEFSNLKSGIYFLREIGKEGVVKVVKN